MGFAVPASIGAQLANPRRRPLVLVGDGAFQMTGLELGTAVRYHLNPVVLVLNNAGYGSGGKFIRLDADSEAEMIRTNVEAVIALTAALVKLL